MTPIPKTPPKIFSSPQPQGQRRDKASTVFLSLDEQLGISVVLWCSYSAPLLRAECLELLWPVCHPYWASVDASALPAYWGTMTSSEAASTDGTERWTKPGVVKMCNCYAVTVFSLTVSHACLVSTNRDYVRMCGSVVQWHEVQEVTDCCTFYYIIFIYLYFFMIHCVCLYKY